MPKEEDLGNPDENSQETPKQAAESAQLKKMAEQLEVTPVPEKQKEETYWEKRAKELLKKDIEKNSEGEYSSSYVPDNNPDDAVRTMVEAAKQLDGSLSFEYNGKKVTVKGDSNWITISERLKWP